MYILGVSCYYHDAAAALLHDGILVAAAEEERFSRVKHDFGFPRKAIRFCLEHPAIFKDQLRAILLASAHGKVQLMYPMISGAEELARSNAVLEECRAELRSRSPCVLISTSSTTRPGWSTRSRPATHSDCQRASGLPRVPIRTLPTPSAEIGAVRWV